MKKLLLLAIVGLTLTASDAFGLFGRRLRNGYYGYNNYGYNRGCGSGGCFSSCNTCYEPQQMCGEQPCCVREQTITVQEPAKMVCGWVCPDGCREVPASEARTIPN